ncbi:MAG: hypothetical protein GXY74_15350 [Phycisphaerae bacterium]|nr:hypothetical protein [Phycisphaerae bacterium]
MPLQAHSWESRRQDDRIATNADQAEFWAIRYGASNIEAGTFDDRVAGALDDYEVIDPRTPVAHEQWNWARDDMALDNATSDIGVELRRRQSILAEAHPFSLEGNRLIHRRSRTLAYEFCLAVAQATSLSEGDYRRLPIAFERLVRDILVCFLGPGAKGLRTGWPADDYEPRPTRFKEVIRALYEMTGEWVWSPEHDLPDDPDPKDVKDEGLDVVVWKEVPDRRPGRLFLLVQCACGNDYATKFSDLDAQFERLSKWIKPISCVCPVRVFSTPRHIPNDPYFRDVNKRAGLALDRSRIALLAESDAGRKCLLGQKREPLENLISLVIDGFQAAKPTRQKQPRRAAGARRSRSRGT